MIPDKHVNDVTVDDLNARFASRSWAEAGGNIQSLLFAAKFLQFKWPLGMQIATGRIHDYGCAEGDGTALLQATFPLAEVTGFDISPVAVETARWRWPTVWHFEVGDVREPQYLCDVAYTSHCLEHLEDPVIAIRRLQEVARLLVVIVPPTLGGDEDNVHLGTRPYDEWIRDVIDDVIDMKLYKIARINPDDRSKITEESVAHLIRGCRL